MSELLGRESGEDGVVSGQIRDFTRRHGELRPRLTESQYRELASAVDEETRLLSGGFESTQSYSDLLFRGPRVVPLLVDDLKQEASWWKIQMVSFFASEIWQVPIEIPAESRGYLPAVNESVQIWWQHSGQPHFQSIEPKLAAGEFQPFN